MNCANCGTANESTARFCVKCGAPLAAAAPPPPPPTPVAAPAYAQPAAPRPPSIQQGKGFFKALFDLSFEDFIAIKIIKFLYILAMIGNGLLCLIMIGSQFIGPKGPNWLGVIAALIFSPVIFIVATIVARIYMEILIVVFKIAEYTEEIAKQKRG